MSIKIEGGGSRENVFSDSDSGIPLWNGAPLLNLVYPVGSIYWSSNNTNPASLFGGTWTQIKDRFILAAGDSYTNGVTGGASTVTLSVRNMPSHNHTFTPNGNVGSHSHGLNYHTHSFSHTHDYSGSGTTGEMSKNSYGSIHSLDEENGLFNAYKIGAGGNVSLLAKSNSWAGGNVKYGNQPYGIDIDVSHTHDFSWSGTTTSQSTSTTDGASGDTTSATPSFTGTQGYTSSNGSGEAFNILPPYIVKYCWERIA